MTLTDLRHPALDVTPFCETGAKAAAEEDSLLFIYENEREAARQRIASLIVLVYYLLIIEGAIRKWVAPAFQRELFFMRDPVVLCIYYIAISQHFWPRRSTLFWSGLALGLASLQVTAMTNLGSLSSVLTAYGFRNYFGYIPLAFIMEEHLRYEDWRRIVNFTLLTAGPIAILCIIQSLSAPTAVINAGFGRTSDSMFVPLAVGNLERAYGPFTAGNVMAEYVGSLFAMVLWLLAERHEGFDKRLVGIGAVACVVLLSVSGHRSAWVMVSLVLIGGFVATASVRGIRAAGPLAGVSVLLSLLLMLCVKFIFTTQSSELLGRFQGVAAEDTSRYSYGLLGEGGAELYRFADVIPETDWGGEGLGASGNAADLTGASVRIAAEDDWSRNVVALGPILGVCFIFYRLALVASLGSAAALAAARFKTYLPILLISFIGITLLDGQITGQGSINGYGWLFAGFCMAANAGNLLQKRPADCW
ncbi:MAG: hypothetical protein ABSG46_08885 [Candidatus Binataceae bacterium]